MKKPEWKSVRAFVAARIARYDRGHNFTCDICGREVFENERICGGCMEALPWNNGAICPFCGRKVKEAGACLDCKEKPLGTVKARSCFTYEKEAARLVNRMKNGEKYLAETFGGLMFSLYQTEFSCVDAITFVPMTEKAEKKRGYNQSRLLAEALSVRSGKPLFEGVEKTRDTPPQKSLGRRERENNLKDCFRVTQKSFCKGKCFLIVDDALTTGATACSLSEVFRRAGAQCCLLTATSVEKQNPFGKPPRKDGRGNWRFSRNRQR